MNNEKTFVKLSFYGKAMRFYMWFGRFAFKIMMRFTFAMLVSLTLTLSVPQFSLHKPGVEISHFIPLAIAQVAVGITLLVSMAGGVAFALLAGFLALLEMPIELSLKKRVYKLVKERQKMSMDELVRETGVLENDLSFLIKNWIITKSKIEDIYKVNQITTGIIKRGHLQIDLKAKELSWQE
jgi:hypothetical protein